MNDNEKLNENNNIIERIWKIREYIQKLEDIKESIINFLNSRKKLDEVTKNLWISDVIHNKDFSDLGKVIENIE